MTPAEDKPEPEFIVFPPMPGTSIGIGLPAGDSVHYSDARLRDDLAKALDDSRKDASSPQKDPTP